MKTESRLILNDHALRSKLVFQLLSSFQASRRSTTPASVPRAVNVSPFVLIQFWDDLTTIPEDVRCCIDSWSAFKRFGLCHLLFDHATARHFIEQNYSPEHLAAYGRCHHPAMQCDYFRLCFLLKNGGTYIDADEQHVGDTDFCSLLRDRDLKLQPLCFDLNTAQMVPASQFINEPYRSDRIYYFNNNPIIARVGDPIIGLALQRATKKLLSTQLLRDIQATTGPGNITESLLLYYLEQQSAEVTFAGFRPLFEWDDVSISKWPLSYRGDERNWRNCKLPE